MITSPCRLCHLVQVWISYPTKVFWNLKFLLNFQYLLQIFNINSIIFKFSNFQYQFNNFNKLWNHHLPSENATQRCLLLIEHFPAIQRAYLYFSYFILFYFRFYWTFKWQNNSIFNKSRIIIGLNIRKLPQCTPTHWGLSNLPRA